MPASKTKPAPRTSAAPATPAAQPPKGMKTLDGGFAKNWDVEQLPILEGKVEHEVKTVTLNKGTKKEADRRCCEVRTADGDRYTLWESAALVSLFEKLAETGAVPCKVWISFKGYGTAKKGQNAPKLFDVAVG